MRKARNRQVADVRYISAASIQIGDLIAVVWRTGDITHTRRARIAKRDYDGAMRVFLTADGQEVFRWHPSHDKEFRITLLESATLPATALFDFPVQ